MDKFCTNCVRRARCVSLGWLSPSGFWFPDQVVIRPQPGCHLHDLGATQVMRQLGIAVESAAAPAPDDTAAEVEAGTPLPLPRAAE